MRTGADEIVVGVGSPKIDGSDVTYSATVVTGLRQRRRVAYHDVRVLVVESID